VSGLLSLTQSIWIAQLGGCDCFSTLSASGAIMFGHTRCIQLGTCRIASGGARPARRHTLGAPRLLGRDPRLGGVHSVIQLASTSSASMEIERRLSGTPRIILLWAGFAMGLETLCGAKRLERRELSRMPS